MSISAIASSVSYDGNDVADDFPVPFRFLEDNDLTAKTTDDGGVTYTTLALDTDYTLDGAGPDDGTGTPEGGTLTLTGGALATGTRLVIERNTDRTQEKTFTPQGEFSPIQYSRMVDKLTLIVQELARRLAVLEALGDLVDVTAIAGGTTITDAFTASDPIEDTFPRQIACANGANASLVLWHVYATDADDNPMDEPPAVDWVAGPDDHITVRRISGLAPGIDYTAEGMVFFT